MNNDEAQILGQTIQHSLQEKERNIAMLRTVNDVLNASQDIEDIIDDENLLDAAKLVCIREKAQKIQQLAMVILPG
jgi:hypothetical protein